MLNNLIVTALVLLSGGEEPSVDTVQVKQLIYTLYREPVDLFVYSDGRGKDVSYWRTFYGKYYSEKVVSLIIEHINNRPNEPCEFISSDPRFGNQIYEEHKLIKLSLDTPKIKDTSCSVIVRFTTTDGLTKDHRITVYYL